MEYQNQYMYNSQTGLVAPPLPQSSYQMNPSHTSSMPSMTGPRVLPTDSSQLANLDVVKQRFTDR